MKTQQDILVVFNFLTEMRKKHIIFFFYLSMVHGQSSTQIEQAKQIIKAQGLSEKQVRSIAKQKGFSEKKIDEVYKNEKSKSGTLIQNPSFEITPRIDQVKVGNPVELENLKINQNPESEDKSSNFIEDIPESEPHSKNKKASLSYFGYDIFKKDPALFQASLVGAVDPNYSIGPGDEIIVMLWGETQFRQVLSVDREGFVFIPEVGQVFVNGLNLKLLESKLFKVFSQYYNSLNPQGRKPTTFLDVSLGNLRPLRIQVLGEVSQPGAYTVSPSVTLFSSLYYFKGPTTNGSLRDIRLIRGGEEIGSIDFYDYLLTGKKPKDIKMQIDDVVYIPKRMKTVSIQGELNRPGIYELELGESLKNLIEIAGGLKITAYLDRAQIDRIVPFDKRELLGVDRMFTDVDLGEILKSEEKFNLQDGDWIQVFSVLDSRQNIVELRGAVTRPGTYDLGSSLRLSDLILKADSLLGDAYLERVDIVRIKPDYGEELIKLDLKKALMKDPEHDILLQGLDSIRVYSLTEMVPKTYVSINGHVKNPGKYLLQDNMTLYDLIFKSGGFIDKEFKKLAYLDRAELVRFKSDSDEKEILSFNLNNVLNKKDIAFMDMKADDEVRIYSLSEIKGDKGYVKISGNVKHPGDYELFEGNMTLYDLLFKAGGFDDPIFKAKTHTARADLIRFNPGRITKKIIQFNLGEILKNKENEENINLLTGDEIFIYSNKLFNIASSIYIEGLIKKPGRYELKTGMSIKDLLLEAGGFSKKDNDYKIEIARSYNRKDESEYSIEIIDIEIDKEYNVLAFDSKDSKAKNILLKKNDYVIIRSSLYKEFGKKIEITGQVLYPGLYILQNNKETIYDVLIRAGGLMEDAYAGASTFTRENKTIQIDLSAIFKRPKSDKNFQVANGDIINVAKRSNVIQISGEVNSPGFYGYIKGNSLRKTINEAGGFTPNVDYSNIFIKYKNGKSQIYKRWISNPKVEDGAEIYVGSLPEEEPFDKTEYIKELTSIIANIAQVISIVILAKS